ncbi:SDR family oxidoreductase [Flavihumibacter solisilvae]|uniref:Short-chain dehydrogenase n=1 Tax=Flavihumibacter solisilvae TaxID=1349421 RepID=A0A0C1L4I1_9BACT|nr:SDR family oxidoreductase [Flavihumibacter solisilvae]KIC95012.1 short-chain dehydrogenase [Flavihumibacter solisilvae]
MNRLSKRTALITGGNSGIGLATAREFIAEGASVIITGRNKAALDKAVLELGPQAHGIVSDTSNMKDILKLRDEVVKIFPRLDVLFINAGVAIFTPITEVTEEEFDQQFNINVKGAYFTIQQLLPIFNEGGSIILNASNVAHKGVAGASVYSASKAAILNLAKTLSSELLTSKIRVNAISPGPVATPIYEKLGFGEAKTEEFNEVVKGKVPLGRFGNPNEIARIAVFFASEDSSFVLGAELIADGGYSTL